jgi:hypothetical protein
MDHFDWPSQKKHDSLILPKHYHFLPIWIDYVGATPRNILNTHLALLHCLSRTFIPKFAHHHFWLKLLQELRYFLGFILINLVVVHPKVFECFDGCFYANGPFGWPLTKNIMKSPLLK